MPHNNTVSTIMGLGMLLGITIAVAGIVLNNKDLLTLGLVVAIISFFQLD